MKIDGAAAPPNVLLELTSTDAAQSVLRPLCLLTALAAQQHVGLTWKKNPDRPTLD
jgi:hypothetical protein